MTAVIGSMRVPVLLVVGMVVLSSCKYDGRCSDGRAGLHVCTGRKAEQGRNNYSTKHQEFFHDGPLLGRLTHCGPTAVSELLSPQGQSLQTATNSDRWRNGADVSSPLRRIQGDNHPRLLRITPEWPGSCRLQSQARASRAPSLVPPSPAGFRWLA